jgi:hypothetical protein
VARMNTQELDMLRREKAEEENVRQQLARTGFSSSKFERKSRVCVNGRRKNRERKLLFYLSLLHYT